MEQGEHGRERQPRRARPTDRDVQELIAQISHIEPDMKVTLIKPSSGLTKIFGTLAAVFRLSGGNMRYRSNR